MPEVTKFNYEGTVISFEFLDGNKMINATEMIKHFPDKKMNNFLRNATTKEYILILETRYANKRIGDDSQEREVLRIVKGGKPELQGTWMDEKLALKFAAWLSVDFELWVYDRIEELLKTGLTRIDGYDPKGFGTALRLIADKFEEQYQINKEIEGKIEGQENRLKAIESKIISSEAGYYTILGYCSLIKIKCPLSQAKIYGKAASALSKEKGYQIGTAYDERYGKVGTYHEEVLKEVIE